MASEAGLNQDFLDLLRELIAAGVEFVVVGAHAMAVHGVPRATGDMDLLVKPSAKTPSASSRRFAPLAPPWISTG